jgi:hypothetical protein
VPDDLRECVDAMAGCSGMSLRKRGDAIPHGHMNAWRRLRSVRATMRPLSEEAGDLAEAIEDTPAKPL